MKKMFRLLLPAIVFLAAGLNVSAATGLPIGADKQAIVYAHIVARVGEIQNMDKTALSSSEKSSMRKELKTMKREADGLDRKVYISVGAIIIIILLLILILR